MRRRTMKNVYFNPGCALSIYKPEMEQRLLKYLNEVYGDVKMHNICCRHHPRVEADTTIINICAGCDRRFSTLYEGVETISFWEVLDQADAFPYPDYKGQTMTVHDACPIRGKSQVHAAIRSLLRKMNIQIVEAERHGARSVCCGDDFYPKYPLEQVHKRMKSRADSMPCEQVVVYCVSCIKAMVIGGKSPRYMIDLLFNETTEAGVYDTVEWHQQLQTYIDATKQP